MFNRRQKSGIMYDKVMREREKTNWFFEYMMESKTIRNDDDNKRSVLLVLDLKVLRYMVMKLQDLKDQSSENEVKEEKEKERKGERKIKEKSKKKKFIS